MPIIDDLQGFGFSEKEAQLYLLLAELGKSTATTISRKSKLSRSSVYFVLENLKQRGCVTAETKNKSTFFTANHPSSLKSEIVRRREELEQQFRVAEKLSTDLLPFFRSKQFHIPKLQFFEGRSAVLEALRNNEDRWHESVLARDSTWWGFEDGSIYEACQPWFEHIWKKFKKIREERLNVRVFSNVPVADSLHSQFPRTLLLPLPTGYKFATSLWLLGDFVVLISTREKPHYLYQLEDPALADSLRVILRLLWKE